MAIYPPIDDVYPNIWEQVKKKLETEGSLNKQYDADLDGIVDKDAYSMLFGDGSDGDIIVTSGNTLVLSDDLNANNLTIESGATLDVNGHIVRVKGKLISEGVITDSYSGGAGGAGAYGNTTCLVTTTTSPACNGASGSAPNKDGGGAGGGGGGGAYYYDGSFWRCAGGGAGGKGGGVVILYAYIIEKAGTIDVRGQNGENANGNCDFAVGGGGGGGGGGTAIVKSMFYYDKPTLLYNGGVGGSGVSKITPGIGSASNVTYCPGGSSGSGESGGSAGGGNGVSGSSTHHGGGGGGGSAIASNSVSISGGNGGNGADGVGILI